MSAGWRVAGIAGLAAAAGIAGGVGLAIAKRLTASEGERNYELTIRGVDRSGERPIVLLDRTPRSTAPGLYCLLLERGGLVRLSARVKDHGSDLVGREVLGELPEGLTIGTRASWSGIYFSSPADAGLDATDVDIETDVGKAPAWLITSSNEPSSTWAIHIHGLGSPRAGTLRGVQVATASGLTSLVVSYRNDGEGPTVGSGRTTLGATESDDVRDSLRYALEHGASRVILFGWSMGAAIALQLAADPEFRGVVVGLVLESPVLDWASTIKANCARSGLPTWAGALAAPWLDNRGLARVTGLRAPVSLRHFDWIARADELRVPTLMLHGSLDTSAPFAVSARLRDLRPDLVELEEFDADHAMNWNSDPERWHEWVTLWLGKCVDQSSAPRLKVRSRRLCGQHR